MQDENISNASSRWRNTWEYPPYSNLNPKSAYVMTRFGYSCSANAMMLSSNVPFFAYSRNTGLMCSRKMSEMLSFVFTYFTCFLSLVVSVCIVFSYFFESDFSVCEEKKHLKRNEEYHHQFVAVQSAVCETLEELELSGVFPTLRRFYHPSLVSFPPQATI